MVLTLGAVAMPPQVARAGASSAQFGQAERVPVLDLVCLDSYNPRAIAFQVGKLTAHLNKLPVLSDTGLAELQQEQARALAAIMVTARATSIDTAMLWDLENRLGTLSQEIARRYFLQGAEPLREAGMILA